MGLDRIFGRIGGRIEEDPSFLEEVRRLYTEYGQPMPRINTIIARLGYENQSQVLKTIRETGSRIQEGTLSSPYFAKAAALGMRNLRRVTVRGTISHIEARDLDLDYAELSRSKFIGVDFSNTNFDRAEVYGTEFFKSILNTARIPAIRLLGGTIDLKMREVVLNDSGVWNIHKSGIEEMGSCSDCELHNGEIIRGDADGVKLRRGVLFSQEGKPLGYMKLKGDRTFLALRTVSNEKGEVIFWKGMVYALEEDLVQWINQRSKPFEEDAVWRLVEVEALAQEKSASGRAFSDLGRNNQRFLKSPNLYEEMGNLVERIEKGEEPMRNILTGEMHKPTTA